MGEIIKVNQDNMTVSGRDLYEAFGIKEYNSAYSDHAGIKTLITPKGRETFRLLIKDLEGEDG